MGGHEDEEGGLAHEIARRNLVPLEVARRELGQVEVLVGAPVLGLFRGVLLAGRSGGPGQVAVVGAGAEVGAAGAVGCRVGTEVSAPMAAGAAVGILVTMGAGIPDTDSWVGGEARSCVALSSACRHGQHEDC